MQSEKRFYKIGAIPYVSEPFTGAWERNLDYFEHNYSVINKLCIEIISTKFKQNKVIVKELLTKGNAYVINNEIINDKHITPFINDKGELRYSIHQLLLNRLSQIYSEFNGVLGYFQQSIAFLNGLAPEIDFNFVYDDDTKTMIVSPTELKKMGIKHIFERNAIFPWGIPKYKQIAEFLSVEDKLLPGYYANNAEKDIFYYGKAIRAEQIEPLKAKISNAIFIGDDLKLDRANAAANSTAIQGKTDNFIKTVFSFYQIPFSYFKGDDFTTLSEIAFFNHCLLPINKLLQSFNIYTDFTEYAMHDLTSELTINEQRSIYGLKPVENGDYIYYQKQDIPIDLNIEEIEANINKVKVNE